MPNCPFNTYFWSTGGWAALKENKRQSTVIVAVIVNRFKTIPASFWCLKAVTSSPAHRQNDYEPWEEEAVRRISKWSLREQWNRKTIRMSDSGQVKDGCQQQQPQPTQPFKLKTSNTIQFMRQTSLTKIGGLLNSMNKNRQLQSQLSHPGERDRDPP